MRRALFAGLAACAAAAVLAAPAAAFDHHFTVVSQTISDHQSKDGYHFSERLLSPHNRNNSVGRDKGVCTGPSRGGKVHCLVVVHLSGDIGGRGSLVVKGNLGRHDNTLNVVSGDGGLNGAGGKVLIKSHHRIHFDITR